MNNTIIFFTSILILSIASCNAKQEMDSASEIKPNIIYVMLDDAG